MSINLDNIFKYEDENSKLEFKSEQYLLGDHHNRNEFLKDISAFANHPSDDEKYIIIGVNAKDGIFESLVNIDAPVDDAKYQNFLYDNVEPKINFDYKTIEYQGYLIAYFRIHDNNERPYLFKKEVKKPQTNIIEYRIGDGFIRQGSSTRKMTRSDLDSIYLSKNSNQDRKNELTILPIVHKFPNNWKCLDVNIENTSNKSINFYIEMKVFNAGCKTMSGNEFDQLMKNQTSNNQPFEVVHTNINYRMTTHPDYIHIQGNLIRGFTIKQNSTEDSVFDTEIFIHGKDLEIKAQLILRSDDFTSGALVKDITFQI